MLVSSAVASFWAAFSWLFFLTLFLLFLFEPKNVLPGTVSIQVHQPFYKEYTPKPYNNSKLALLLENRIQPHLTPLLLHFISVVPPDWTFKFMGSNESMAHINKSATVREYQRLGKLSVEPIPLNMSVNNQEELSRTMTTAWFYERLLPAEWLFIFQTDSMICANAVASLNDWVEGGFTWVGAPWGKNDRWGGNGGFSLRKISHLLQVLTHQNRYHSEALEDWWLTERLGHMPNTKMANGTEEMSFSVEKVPFPNPIGYHTGHSGRLLMGQVWQQKEQRDQIFEYCPEIKMLMSLVLETEAEGCGVKDISNSFPF